VAAAIYISQSLLESDDIFQHLSNNVHVLHAQYLLQVVLIDLVID